MRRVIWYALMGNIACKATGPATRHPPPKEAAGTSPPLARVTAPAQTDAVRISESSLASAHTSVGLSNKNSGLAWAAAASAAVSSSRGRIAKTQGR